MLVQRQSAVSGKHNTMEIPVTNKQLEDWKYGGLIQNVMPELSSDHQQFLQTGITPKEWDDIFK